MSWRLVGELSYSVRSDPARYRNGWRPLVDMEAPSACVLAARTWPEDEYYDLCSGCGERLRRGATYRHGICAGCEGLLGLGDVEDSLRYYRSRE